MGKIGVNIFSWSGVDNDVREKRQETERQGKQASDSASIDGNFHQHAQSFQANERLGRNYQEDKVTGRNCEATTAYGK